MPALFCNCGTQMRYDAETRRAVCDKCAKKKGASPSKTRGTRKPSTRAPKPALVPVSPQDMNDAAREKHVQNRLIQLLRERGYLVIRFNSGAPPSKDGTWFQAYYIPGLLNENRRPTSAGFPDVVAIVGEDGYNRIHFFEIKTKGGKLRETQERFIKYAKQFHVEVHTCRDWNHAEEIAESLPDYSERRMEALRNAS